jgi:hypothetical protein
LTAKLVILAATAVSKPLPLDDGEGSLIQLVLYIPVVYNILANDSALTVCVMRHFSSPPSPVRSRTKCSILPFRGDAAFLEEFA